MDIGVHDGGARLCREDFLQGFLQDGVIEQDGCRGVTGRKFRAVESVGRNNNCAGLPQTFGIHCFKVNDAGNRVWRFDCPLFYCFQQRLMRRRRENKNIRRMRAVDQTVFHALVPV
ncbi:hypothetical protein D3C71_1684110 [compost metagenome]